MWSIPQTGPVSGPASPWELIDKKSASGDATLDVSWDKEYEIVLGSAYNIVPATADTELHLRTSSDGSTFDAGASDYATTLAVFSGGTAHDNSAALSEIQCLGEVSTNFGLTNHGHLDFMLQAPYDAAVHTVVSGQGGYLGTTTHFASIFSGRRAAAAAVKGVRFLMSVGNLTTMELVMYGLLRTR